VHGVLAALLSFAPAPAVPEPVVDVVPDLSADECRERELDLFVGYGSADAPKLLKVYIDPIEPNQLKIWLEARRIVGERDGELRLELIPTRGGRATGDRLSDSVRMWFVTAAALGAAEQALRLLDGQDWQRIAAQIRTREGRAALARELGVEPEHFEARRSGASGACLTRSFERTSKELAVQTVGQLYIAVGLVDANGFEQIHYTDENLSDLRSQLDRLGMTPAFIDEVGVGFVPFGPSLGTGRSSRLDRTFSGTGVLLGGEALPHRLVIFVEDEEHGRLPDWLDPAMRYRSQHPGMLSIQVIAAGVGSRAITLRRRLCAARTLGLEVEYVLHLAQRPALRRLHEESLYEALEGVANSDACSDSEPLDPGPDGDGSDVRGSDFGHPRGAWLDGRPVNPSDLESLEWQLDNELEPSLIDWLTTPETFVGGESFEFEF
jgi:hypothetical protein